MFNLRQFRYHTELEKVEFESLERITLGPVGSESSHKALKHVYSRRNAGCYAKLSKISLYVLGRTRGDDAQDLANQLESLGIIIEWW